MPQSRLNLLVLNVEIAAGTGTFCKNLGLGLHRLFPQEIKPSLLMMRQRTLTDEERSAYEDVHMLGSNVGTNWRRFYQTPLDVLRLRRAVKRLKPDLIFCIGTYSNLLASLAAGPRRTIMSEHMNMTLRTQAARFGGIMCKLMHWRYPKSLIVVAARGIATDLRQNFGARETRIIPNGLDADRVRSLADAATNAPSINHPYHIAVGRLTPQKDYPTLFRAFAEARKMGIPQHLVIAGDGELRGELEQLAASLNITDSVHFLGHVANPYPLIRNARSLILSSIFEGFAYVPLEAMALGIPVIATDCPSGPSDILGDGRFGLLVPPADVPQLAAAIYRISTDDSAHQQFVEQAEIRSSQLSVEQMAKDYRDLFVEYAAKLT